MTDTSDCESDAGASPSVSSDESSSSSSSALKIVTPSTSKKRTISGGSTPNVSSSTTVFTTPPSSGRKVPRRKQLSIAGGDETPVSPRKRARLLEPETPEDKKDLLKEECSQKRKRNKRRRTRSERNFLAGKIAAVTPSTGKVEVEMVAEGAAVALDAEIDRVLEEKANKNNLSATNVKSIIRHVITNNMVQKMIMSAVKKRAEVGDLGGSSDEDGLVGPKMTRAKTKELMENQQIQLWPNCYSPVKMPKPPVSETQMLIQHDLPDDSSGDEEYVPKETDISELLLSDDESSGMTSHTSDIGSPSPSPSVARRSIRRSLQTPEVPNIPEAEHVFKTPPPRPKETREESAISRRTRSKFPLKDTPLEALERQLVPPDITTDMYDWGVETDNEDWTDFLKKFWNEAPNINDTTEIDDEGDPEYNVMEDEDVHDQEELRMDRAVKVPKRELNDLISELFEPGFLSGDDIEDNDLSSLTGFTPLANDTDGDGADTSYAETSKVVDIVDDKIVQNEDQVISVVHVDVVKSIVVEAPAKEVDAEDPDPATSSSFTEVIIPDLPEITNTNVQQTNSSTPSDEPDGEEPTFRDRDLQFLEYQMRQHVQLLSQSYVLTASSEDAELQAISKSAKGMVIEIKNFGDANSTRTRRSCFAASNLESAWNIVNSWPHKILQKSPIKKKILEEKYINESRLAEDDTTYRRFPRHIVKVIAEHNAFMYNHLLPESLFQKATSRVTFCVHEDILLVKGLEDLKSTKLSIAQMAEIISRLLLVVHPPNSVYHRIRNLRRHKAYCDEVIKRYFAEGVLPEVDRAIQQVELQPLVGRSKEWLTSRWLDHLKSLEDLPSHQWEGKPITGQISRKSKKSKVNDGASTSKNCTINRVFPNGTYLFDNKDPNVDAIPILNANGQPGAIIYVPKGILKQNEPVPIPVQVPTIPAITKGWNSKQVDEPRPGAEAGSKTQEGSIEAASSLNRPALEQKAPLLNAVTGPSSFRAAPVVSTIQSMPYPPGFGYHVVQPVGKPFSLNLPLPSNGGGGNQIIDLASLQTPIKKEIFQKANRIVPDVDTDEEETDPMDDGSGGNVPEDDVLTVVIDDPSDTSVTPEICAVPDESKDNSAVSKRRKSDDKRSAGGSSGNAGNINSTSKTGGGGSESKETSKHSSETGRLKASGNSKLTSSRQGKGDDDREDENENRGNRKRTTLNDCTKEDANEDGNNNGPENKKPSKKAAASGGVSAVSPGSSQNKSVTQNKKAKRNPSNTQMNSHSSKDNAASVKNEPETFDAGRDAYMEAYLAKVEATTELNHPDLYSAFVQILIEAGEGPVNQPELYSKVKILFKDYPELLNEFKSFLDTSMEEVNDASNLVESEWCEEEDEQILRICQQEPDMEVAWQKMAELLPHRCLETIKSRCNELIEIIREAKAQSE